MLSADEMNDTCGNLMDNETSCFDCIACEVADCIDNITNCDEYLATIYTDCCTENCNGLAVGAGGRQCGFSLLTTLMSFVR